MKLDKQSNQLLREVVDLFREQRHDFLNHFQVVLGYLQLNKADRAVAYMKQVNSEMQELSSITKLENPYLVVMLLLGVQKSKSLGIELSFDVADSCSLCQEDYNEDYVDQLAYCMDQVFRSLSAGSEAEPWMDILLQESDQEIIWMITCSSFLAMDDLVHQLKAHFNEELQGLTKNGSLEINKLPEQVRLIFRTPKNN